MRLVRCPPEPDALQLVRSQYEHYRVLQEAFQKLGEGCCDRVYVGLLDNYDKVVSVLGSPFGQAPFAGFLMAPKFYHSEAGIDGPRCKFAFLQRALFRRLLQVPTLTAIITDQEPLRSFVRPADRPKIWYVPPPGVLNSTIDRVKARQDLGIGTGSVVVLVYGTISERKGLASLVSALAHPACPPSVIALIAGRQADTPHMRELRMGPEMRTLVASRRLIELNTFIDDDLESRVFRAADIVWVGYPGFQPASGVLAQACVAGCPVLAGEEGIIGSYTKTYGIGESINLNRIEDIAGALRRLAEDAPLRAELVANMMRIAPTHTVEYFASRICDAILNSTLP